MLNIKNLLKVIKSAKAVMIQETENGVYLLVDNYVLLWAANDIYEKDLKPDAKFPKNTTTNGKLADFFSKNAIGNEKKLERLSMTLNANWDLATLVYDNGKVAAMQKVYADIVSMEATWYGHDGMLRTSGDGYCLFVCRVKVLESDACYKAVKLIEGERKEAPEDTKQIDDLKAENERLKAELVEIKAKQAEQEEAKEEEPEEVKPYTIGKGTRKGAVEIYFTEKPEAEVIETLKGMMFHWNWKKHCWYGFTTEEELERKMEEVA